VIMDALGMKNGCPWDKWSAWTWILE